MNISYGFNDGTDYSQWATANGPWSASDFSAAVDAGSKSFTTYHFVNNVQTPGLGIVQGDMDGAMWTPDQAWTWTNESFGSLSMIEGQLHGQRFGHRRVDHVPDRARPGVDRRTRRPRPDVPAPQAVVGISIIDSTPPKRRGFVVRRLDLSVTSTPDRGAADGVTPEHELARDRLSILQPRPGSSAG